MSKTKKIAVKPTAKSNKKKLSPAERSQIAKDRWVKRRAGGAPKETKDVVETAVLSDTPNALVTLTNGAVTAVTITHGAPSPPVEPFRPTPQAETILYTPPVEVTPIPHEAAMAEMALQGEKEKNDALVESMRNVSPAPQLAPAPPKKQKRYTGPKEFSVALKAAENRLAKAIVERAQAAGQLAALQAEIPSLLGIINALKGSGNYAPPVPYDLSGGVPNAQAFQTPLQQPQFQNGPDLAAIQAAMDAAQVAIPISKARGGVQLSPEVVGSLEGPDDDEDRFLTGVGEKGWIGG